MGHDHCGTQGCGSGGGEHHHHDKSGCCGGCCNCQCHSKSCGSEHEECHFTDELIEMADEAWMEVLHEKIKERIIAKSGGRLDELAAIVADANADRWKHKLGQHKQCDDFKAKVAHFFEQSCCDKGSCENK
ncbi:MAG: hypothetical protein Q8K75_03420 [Chlamydiales bacterium]|nr:hypothetical protein [Chlamydiales bacterium]